MHDKRVKDEKVHFKRVILKLISNLIIEKNYKDAILILLDYKNNEKMEAKQTLVPKLNIL